jgi:branched-chain amino acid transport system permease protein
LYVLQVAEFAAIGALLAISAYLGIAAGRLVMCLGSLMAFGAFVAGVVQERFSMPFPLAATAAGIACASAGFVLAWLLRSLEGLPFAVATLGIGELARALAVNTEALGGALGYRAFQFIGRPGPALVAFAIAVGCLIWFEFSWLRRAAAVTRSSVALAESQGIDPRGVVMWLVAAASCLAGVAGALYLRAVGIIDPSLYGFENSLRIVTFALLGGANLFVGAAVGGAALTVLPEVLRFTAVGRMLLYGAVLVGVVLLRPDGLVPRRRAGFTPPRAGGILPGGL